MGKRILIADDDRLNATILKDILVNEGYEVHTVVSGLDVLNAVYEFKPSIILLDIIMPGLDGFNVCKRLKGDYSCKNIPVIMVTARTHGKDLKTALEVGAFDYIKKPIDEIEVIARVQSALRYKEYQDKLQEMAMKDGLTGLYNHSLLIELLSKEYLKQIRKGDSIAFVMLDIDYFKKVNDTYGHMNGDIVLKKVSEIITSTLRESDIVGRYGGEEFGIVLPSVSKDGVVTICERIRRKVEYHPFDIGNQLINITISAGICYKPSLCIIPYKEMMKTADKALYQAKHEGRNNVKIIVADN